MVSKPCFHSKYLTIYYFCNVITSKLSIRYVVIIKLSINFSACFSSSEVLKEMACFHCFHCTDIVYHCDNPPPLLHVSPAKLITQYGAVVTWLCPLLQITESGDSPPGEVDCVGCIHVGYLSRLFTPLPHFCKQHKASCKTVV